MISRVLSVSRIHTVAWPLLLAWPLGILIAAFALSWTIFAIADTGESNFTGSVSALVGVALAFYVSAMTQTFPFALGLSVTRRDYFAATLLVGLCQVVGYSVLFWALSGLEGATGGWGVDMVMFGIPAYFTSSQIVQLATYLALLSLVGGFGLFIGGVYQRWRVTGLFTFGTTTLVTLGCAAVVVTWQEWWASIGSWFVDTPRFVPMVVLPAALAAMCLVGAGRLIRRATA